MATFFCGKLHLLSGGTLVIGGTLSGFTVSSGDGAPAWLRAALPTAARPPTPTTTTGALRRLGACSSDDAARRAVERAVGTEEGALW